MPSTPQPKGGRSITERSSTTPNSTAPSKIFVEEDGAVIIAAQGDLVLRVKHDFASGQQEARFRVSTSVLREHSKYFERMLQAGRFGEGIRVDESLNALNGQYKTLAAVPVGELPVVTAEDLGRISTVKAIAALLTDFFSILHGVDIQGPPLVSNLANLVVVADRFDALDAVKTWSRRKKTSKLVEAKMTPKSDAALTEERVRQRVFIGLMLEDAAWLEKYTARIITKGWVGREADPAAPLWYDLPMRLEQELALRREYVLDTIQSLQNYFLGLYTSRERQCKLGYDSSPQCDSFQLGEMVRFFARAGTLRLQGAVIDTSQEAPEPYAGDINLLLDSLRQVPEYQIDRHHTHCGIRIRIVPLLALIEHHLLSVGICAECWISSKGDCAWLNSKRPLLWQQAHFRPRPHAHDNGHADIRAMFMASDRDWS